MYLKDTSSFSRINLGLAERWSSTTVGLERPSSALLRMENEQVCSDLNLIPILKQIRNQLFKLLSIDRGAIGAALITQHIVPLLIAHAGVTTGNLLVLEEHNVRGSDPTDGDCCFVQEVFLEDFPCGSRHDQASGAPAQRLLRLRRRRGIAQGPPAVPAKLVS